MRTGRPQAGQERPRHNPDQWYKSIHGAYGYLFRVIGMELYDAFFARLPSAMY